MTSFLVVLFESVGSIVGVVCTVAAAAGGCVLSAERRVLSTECSTECSCADVC